MDGINTIGILRADYDVPELIERYGPYPEMFFRLFRAVKPSLQFKVYDVPNGELPQEVTECDGYIIPGSRSGVYEHPNAPWINQLAELARRIAAAGVPLAGICFGHQLLAYAFGGKVEKTADKGWGVGAQVYRLQQPSANLPPEFTVLATHQDQVVVKPAGAEVIAANAFCPIAGLISDTDNYITFQGHPEFGKDFLANLIERRRVDIGEEAAARALQTLDAPTHNREIAREILTFFAGKQKRQAA